MTETVEAICPNCSAAVRCRDDRGRAECRCCGWEFLVGFGGEVVDDGEAERAWVLAVDEDGELTAPDADDLTAETLWEIQDREARLRGASGEEWNWNPDDYYEDEEAYLAARGRMEAHAPQDVACPNCLHRQRDVWPGAVKCPACGWHFSVERGGGRWWRDAPPWSRCRLRGDEPPTVVVAQDGTGDFASLAAAVAAALPGTRVRVRPGVYAEELEITESLEVVADGPDGEQVLIGEKGPCLRVTAPWVAVHGLTLRGRRGKRGREFPAVEVGPRSRLILEDCDITSETPACVAVRGRYAKAFLHRCHVHDGAGDGVVDASGGRVTLERCTLARNGGAGFATEGKALVLLRDCAVRDNGAEGVLIRTRAEARVSGCDVSGNGRAGLALRAERAVVHGCRVHGNRGDGVFIEKRCLAVVEHCDIFGNGGTGVAVLASDVTLWDCRIGSGLWAGGKGLTLAFDCDITGNARPAVAVRERAEVSLEGCEVEDDADCSPDFVVRARG
jgi:Right handed beta helix region